MPTESSIDMILQATTSDLVLDAADAEALDGLWKTETVFQMKLPAVPKDRPIPSKEEIEARIPEFRERAAQARTVALVVDNHWAGDFDPRKHPLSRRDALIKKACEHAKELPRRVSFVCSLTGPYLVRLVGPAEDLRLLMGMAMFREVPVREQGMTPASRRIFESGNHRFLAVPLEWNVT